MKSIILNKKNIAIISFIVILISSFATYIYLYPKDNVIDNMPLTESNIEKEKEEEPIKVEIKGALNSPGVYEINKNSRVIDIINLAGGLQENADTSIINLSKKLEDEMVIIIYTKDQINEYINNNKKIEYVYLEKECVCLDDINDGCIIDDNVYATEKNTKKDSNNTVNDLESSASNEANNIVNINIASITELTTLTGIGESKANKIIEYRNTNGNFKSIEDIKNVTGIGDSIYEKIKTQITV
ncbi:MAG: helix-hairpin-helix domain-containing protein [Bacilli bacterium]|nr:helix-hairpin-helix domain-containing protein [Bacilli bacterium]